MDERDELSPAERNARSLSKALVRQLGRRQKLQFHNHSIDYTPGYGLSAMAITAHDRVQAGEPVETCWVHLLPEEGRATLGREEDDVVWRLEVTGSGYRLEAPEGGAMAAYEDVQKLVEELSDRIHAYFEGRWTSQ